MQWDSINAWTLAGRSDAIAADSTDLAKQSPISGRNRRSVIFILLLYAPNAKAFQGRH